MKKILVVLALLAIVASSAFASDTVMETLVIERTSVLRYAEDGFGINQPNGLIEVYRDDDLVWKVQDRFPFLNGFLELGYDYLIQGNITSASDADGSPLSPRLQFRESAGDYYPYFSTNITCDGEFSVQVSPVFDQANGKNGSDSSFLIQYAGVGAGKYQVVGDITIQKIRPNQAPTAIATPSSLTVAEGDWATLSDLDSLDDGGIKDQLWEQIVGPEVSLETTESGIKFLAPFVGQDTEIQIRLTVTDDEGLEDSTIVTVVVKNQPPPLGCIPGDANGDGVFDLRDVILGLQTVSGLR